MKYVLHPEALTEYVEVLRLLPPIGSLIIAAKLFHTAHK
jgi:hypothetical protein